MTLFLDLNCAQLFMQVEDQVLKEEDLLEVVLDKPLPEGVHFFFHNFFFFAVNCFSSITMLVTSVFLTFNS